MEKYQMLVLSTAHITESLNIILSHDTGVLESEYAFMLGAYEFEKYSGHKCVADISNFCLDNGCAYVLLDQDANISENLPTYDW